MSWSTVEGTHSISSLFIEQLPPACEQSLYCSLTTSSLDAASEADPLATSVWCRMIFSWSFNIAVRRVLKLDTSLPAPSPKRIYLSALLSVFDHAPVGPTCVWEDNAACILMSKNPVNHDRSHHIDVKFQVHFLCERVLARKMHLYKCCGPLNVTDALTKSLPQPAFHKDAPLMAHAALTGLSPTRVPRSSFPVNLLVCCTSSPLSRHWIFCCFWFPLLDYFSFFHMTFVAQPRQAFACARGRGKTWVMVIVTGFSLDCLI